MAVTVLASAKAPVVVKGAKAVPALPKRIAKAVAAVVPTIIASPAFALVDSRMNGDGAGLKLGVNEPILGFVIVGVFGTIWALYASSAKSFGAQDEEDGLSL